MRVDGGVKRLLAVGAIAGALGWGIRGVFGGETGAMIPGALFGLCVALAVPRAQPVLFAAVGALAFSIGGSMTYGQTIGLVQDVPNSPTYWWGILGLAIKGGVWIGLGAVILGLGVFDQPLSARRWAVLLLGALILFWLGRRFINGPHDPPYRLPLIYFSDPLSDKPRAECWGGLWLGYLWLLCCAALMGRGSALRLSVFGLVGGAIGFPVGEMLQAWGHLSHPLGQFGDRWIDWWKVMECTFGATAGAALALGAAACRPTSEHTPSPRVGPNWEVWALSGWFVVFLLADLELLPLADLHTLPFLGITLPLCLCGTREATHRDWAAMAVGVTLVFAVSGSDLIGKAAEEAVPGLAFVVVAMVLFTVAGAVMVGRRSTGRLSVAWLLLFIAGSQTLLTAIKSFMAGSSWADGARAFVGGSAITVESLFVVAVLALAWLLREPREEAGTPDTQGS